jgi:predicted DNA-binding transcriptional regulator AlpA
MENSPQEEKGLAMPISQKNWLTRRDVCSYLSCSISFVDTRLPVEKHHIGKLVRYLKTEIDEYLMDHQTSVNVRK